MLAEITERGRETVQRATADLMAADFAMPMYDEAKLEQMFDLFRTLRVAAGDFQY